MILLQIICFQTMVFKTLLLNLLHKTCPSFIKSLKMIGGGEKDLLNGPTYQKFCPDIKATFNQDCQETWDFMTLVI